MEPIFLPFNNNWIIFWAMRNFIYEAIFLSSQLQHNHHYLWPHQWMIREDLFRGYFLKMWGLELSARLHNYHNRYIALYKVISWYIENISGYNPELSKNQWNIIIFTFSFTPILWTHRPLFWNKKKQYTPKCYYKI